MTSEHSGLRANQAEPGSKVNKAKYMQLRVLIGSLIIYDIQCLSLGQFLD